jgi:antitoxin VapB
MPSPPTILDMWYISRHQIPMALSVKDPEADRLAREVAARTGETLTRAVVVALRERLARLRGRSKRRRLRDELREIAQRCAQLPTLDERSGEEILGYDERGLPR